MLKLACPHCQTIGVVPELMMGAGDWPISCHYCHQHYYAPVLSGPETMERQIELGCQHCDTVSRLDFRTFTKISEAEFELLCARCHASLTEGITQITHILTEAVSAQDDQKNADNITLPALQNTDSRTDTQRRAIRHELGAGDKLSYLLIGFGFMITAILAAQEGIIARDWLDQLFAVLSQTGDLLNRLLEMAGPAP
jgi:hypothetical protein